MFQIHDPARGPSIRVDASGRPQEIRDDSGRHVVEALEGVRDETAAYPIERGPRTIFIVRAGGRRLRLVHSIRDGRWSVQELGSIGGDLAVAA